MKSYPDAANEIKAWATIVEAVRGHNFDDVRGMFKDADSADGYVIFNIRHNRYRLITVIHYAKTETRHRLRFSTGERIFGAGAEDAFATSFVQRSLRGKELRIRVDSQCRHCSRPLAIEVDEQLRFRVASYGASPLIFEPDIDWSKFRGANIIHDYGSQTVFFWSEEHARDYRRKQQQPDGAYLTPSQATFSERYVQSGLFAAYFGWAIEALGCAQPGTEKKTLLCTARAAR